MVFKKPSFAGWAFLILAVRIGKLRCPGRTRLQAVPHPATARHTAFACAGLETKTPKAARALGAEIRL